MGKYNQYRWQGKNEQEGKVSVNGCSLIGVNVEVKAASSYISPEQAEFNLKSNWAIIPRWRKETSGIENLERSAASNRC